MAQEMKDSGIAWIGEIPAEYSVHKLKRLIGEHMQYGANESRVEFEHLPQGVR